MQVDLSNGSLQNRIFSGTGSIGGISLPDFKDPLILRILKYDKKIKSILS